MKAKTIEYIIYAIGWICAIIICFKLGKEGYGRGIKQHHEEEKVYININGEAVEMVIDDYENLYLKYNIKGETIYIPYPFLTEEEQENNFENQFTIK